MVKTDLKTQLPASSTFHARKIATSPGSAVSMIYDLPLKILVSRGLPFSNTASGVNRAGISPVSMKVSRLAHFERQPARPRQKKSKRKEKVTYSRP